MHIRQTRRRAEVRRRVKRRSEAAEEPEPHTQGLVAPDNHQEDRRTASGDTAGQARRVPEKRGRAGDEGMDKQVRGQAGGRGDHLPVRPSPRLKLQR